MRLAYVLFGILLAVGMDSAWALRTAQPPTFSEWNTNTFSQLNETLSSFFHVLNGRFQMDVVTVDPDGSRRGSAGEMVLFDTGTDQLCVNVASTVVWKCVNLS